MIRELNKNDYKNFLELISHFRETYFSEKDFIDILEKIKNNMTFIYVYEVDNKIIGTVKLIIETKFIFNISYVAHIEDIFVDKEYRKINVGKKLVEYCINKAEDYNCYKIICVCLNNVKDFYSKCNFETRGFFMSKLIKNKI